MPVEVSPDDFRLMLEKAIQSLPEPFRKALDVVRVELRDRPTRKQLKSLGLSKDELLLGLYEGVPLTQRNIDDGPTLPDVITLFTDDLQDACDDLEELQRETTITLFHELGHYFGFDENELEDFGYG